MAVAFGGGAIGAPGFTSASSSRISACTRTLTSSMSLTVLPLQTVSKWENKLTCVVVCSAVQESSTSAVTSEKKEAKEDEKEAPAAAEEAAAAAAPEKKPKPSAAAKAAVKPLPQMMEEDVIPPLIAILEAQNDVSDIELSYQDNKLEGSFVKKGNPYSFWAFFPTGNLTGAKGFSLSSYGSGASTVEPFLVDERKPTASHIVFWVEKRLAAQGIIPVWDQ